MNKGRANVLFSFYYGDSTKGGGVGGLGKEGPDVSHESVSDDGIDVDRVTSSTVGDPGSDVWASSTVTWGDVVIGGKVSLLARETVLLAETVIVRSGSWREGEVLVLTEGIFGGEGEPTGGREQAIWFSREFVWRVGLVDVTDGLKQYYTIYTSDLPRDILAPGAQCSSAGLHVRMLVRLWYSTF